MCGEIEEENRQLADLLQRFLVHSRRIVEAAPPAKPGSQNAYLDGLFAELLRRCGSDLQGRDEAEAYPRLAMQSLVLARLAGFLAGHVALNEDPLRKLIEAVMLGYGEADMPPADHHHRHHDHDDHHHGDHGHGH